MQAVLTQGDHVEDQLKAGIDTGEECESIIETIHFAELVSIWVDALKEYRKRRES
jgi:hypothetical protein